MSSNPRQFYDFADFRLDLSEKILLRGGQRIPLTPKVFDTLEILVENTGQLLEKNELMQRLWQDHFVEEGNLTSNIKMLRKALGDDAVRPTFIETVPRRGYRFIAEVKRTEAGNQTANASVQPISLSSRSVRTERLRSFALLTAAIIVLAGGITITGYLLSKTSYGRSRSSVLSAPFAAEKLSTNGQVRKAIISADGKNVFYINGTESQQSIWLRQLDNSQNVEIIPPSDDFYYGLALSPDGSVLYFARSGRRLKDMGIYRVSVFGGIPTKIITGSEGWMSISPDGSMISFVRCAYKREEYCSLWIADALDGGNEKKLASRPQPIRIADNKFSPDGKSVAFAVGQSQNQGNDFGLEAIDIESGEIRSLTSERFFNIKSLAWLPDNPGLLVTAAKTPNRRFRIWEVSPHSGKAEPITNDSESYATLSLNSGTDLLISTQVKQDFHLALFSYSGSTGPRVLGEALHAAFFPNGKIVFSSAMSGNDEIWSMNDDGGHRKQLTTDPSDDTGPISSPGNEFIYFSSNRTGMSQVWRMRADGSNQTQVTQKEEGGSPIFVSPDGNWVYYLHGVDRKLWRVSADGGGDELVLDQRAIYFAISPDGEKVAFSTRSNDGGRLITIASLADGKVLHTISAAFSESHANNMAWMPDGGSILYVLPGNDEVGSSLVRHNLAEPKGVIIADLGPELIYSVAVSPDGKSFAVVRGAWKHDMVLIRGLK